MLSSKAIGGEVGKSVTRVAINQFVLTYLTGLTAKA
jgi:hypothetical protein